MSPALRRRLWEYVLLMRLDKPVGILLLLWPVLWALWIAADGSPPIDILLIFVLGTVLTRSAGCIINDFADRDIDPHVERTRERPLAARRVSPYEALILCAILLLVAFGLVLQLDRHTAALAVVAAGLLISYPFFKRFFPAPQLYLGIAFGWGVPMAFVAVQGEVGALGWLIFAITTLWALIYDTYYAMVDRDDDRELGIHSTALLFGRADLAVISSLQLLMIAGLWKMGHMAALGTVYFVAVAVAAVLFHRHLWWARHRERAGCFKAFLGNQTIGLVMFVGIALATAQR
jgi:4-hydroxybenzoate polyprenyltransferase